MKTFLYLTSFAFLWLTLPAHAFSTANTSLSKELLLLGTCNSPTIVSCDDMISDNTANGQSTINEYGAALSTGAELIYQLTPTVDADVVIELTNLVADLDLFLFTDCTDPKNSTIASSTRGNTSAETITIGLSAGTTYFISVDGFAGNTSTFDLSITCTAIETPCAANGAFFEDFENGQPNGWTFSVTGGSANAVWDFDADAIGTSSSSGANPGSGNWASYDDDDAGNSGAINVATATTPILDLSAINDIVLSFDYNYQELNDEEVTLSITDGTTIFYWNGFVWTNTLTPWLRLSSKLGTFSQLIPNSLAKNSLSITLEYSDVDAAWAEGFGFDNFGLCGSTGNSCPMTLAVDDNPIASDTYAASNELTSSGTISSGSIVVFEAGQSITLQAGFQAQAGSDFTARIQSCNANVTNDMLVEKRTQSPERSPSINDVHIFPNPFHQQSTVVLELTQSEEVQISLFNLSGQHLSTIIPNTVLPSGKHTFNLTATHLTSGIYLLSVRVGRDLKTLKITRID
jgi:hypothetical protein